MILVDGECYKASKDKLQLSGFLQRNAPLSLWRYITDSDRKVGLLDSNFFFRLGKNNIMSQK